MKPRGTNQRPGEDEHYNPGASQEHAREERAAGRPRQSDRNRTHQPDQKPDNSSADDQAGDQDNFDDIAEREANPEGPAGNQDAPDAQEAQPWQTDVSQQPGGAKKPESAYSRYKKIGIVGGIIIALTIGGLGTFYGLINSFLISMKENYYEWSMKRGYTRTAQRAARVAEKSIFSDPDSCKKGLKNIRCRYKSGVTKSKLAHLQRTGATVEYDKSKSKRNRYVIRKITLSDGTVLTKDNYLEQFKKNKAVRGFHARATDVTGTFTRTTTMVRKIAKMGMSRQNPLKGADKKEDFKKKLRQALLRKKGSIGVRAPTAQTDENGDVTNQGDIDDANGLSENIEQAAAQERERLLNNPDAKPTIKPPDAGALGKAAAGGGIKGGLKGLSLLGAADSACTGFRILKAVDYGAKFYRALALIRYAGVFMTFADAIKAGKATPAQINYMALFLLTPDKNGRNFFDSPGFQNVLYGLKPNKNSIAKYTNGTTFAGIIGKVRNTIQKLIGGDPYRKCKVIQNPFVQIGAGVVSVVVAIFSGGSSIAASVSVGVGVGIILGVLEAWAVPILVQYAAGTVVTGDETSYEAGTAIAAGMGAMSGQLGRAQGLRPMSDAEVAASETELNESYNSLFADQKPSLTDKIKTNLTAFAARFMFSPVFSTPQKLLAYAGTNISTAEVYAVDEVHNDTSCDDPEYNQNNIATDAFCNPIYGENVQRINAKEYDPEAVIRFMLADSNLSDNNPGNPDAAYIDASTGEPASTEHGEEYKNYKEVCMDGTAAMVDFMMPELDPKIPDDFDSILDFCSSEKHKYNMFRFYQWDSNIVEPPEALNDEFYNSNAGGQGSGQLAQCGSAQECAKKILANKNVTYQPGHKAEMQSIAKTGKANGTKVSAKLLQVILSAAQSGIKLEISSTTGGTHSSTSNHYKGTAVDIGNESIAGKLMPYIYKNRNKFGIDELIYAHPPSGTKTLSNGKPHQYNGATLSAHANHIHFSVK